MFEVNLEQKKDYQTLLFDNGNFIDFGTFTENSQENPFVFKRVRKLDTHVREKNSENSLNVSQNQR